MQLEIPPIINVETGQLQIQTLQIIFIAISVSSWALSLYGNIFIKMSLQKFERVPIAVASVPCNDVWAVAVVATYATPLATFAIKDFNLWIAGAIILILLAIVVLSNVVFPSPLLILRGYHFYKITNIDGGGDYCLLTKRARINNSKTINKVVCAFDYLMIEVR